MRSSCAPYKDCLKKEQKKKKNKRKGGGVKKTYKKLTYNKNINGKSLQTCSTNPMTGFYRDGKCMTGVDDIGIHTVCQKMNKEFLEYTKSKGNDLYFCCKTW